MGTRVSTSMDFPSPGYDAWKDNTTDADADNHQFVATKECPAPETIKQTIISAKDGSTSTIKSRQHDVFQSTDQWPIQYDGRAVIGLSYTDSQSGDTDEEIIKRYKDARDEGRDDRRTVWAYVYLFILPRRWSITNN